MSLGNRPYTVTISTENLPLSEANAAVILTIKAFSHLPNYFT